MRAGTVLLAALAAIFTFSVSAHAGPRLELSMDAWDFGVIYQWTSPSVTIGIKNPGDEPLEISDVKASCGCTATFLSSKRIMPGDKGFLKIEFASYTVTGRINKLVRLTTNDPAARQKDIAIRGLVKDDKAAVGELDKDYVDLGVVAPYETRAVDVLINNRGNIDLDIRDIELPKGWFLDSAAPSRAKARGGASARFGYRPARQKGPIDDVIRINTSGLGGGALDLRVVGYVDECSKGGDFVVLTPTGFSAKDSGGSTLVLSVKNDGQSPVTIEGVDSSLDVRASEQSASEIGPGGSGTVKLDVDPAGLGPGARGYVYIRLGLPVDVK